MPRVSERVSDGDLIQRIGTGDRNAFEALYRRFARPVFGLALRRLGDRGRAEDALQETFTSIWRSASTYSPERGPGAPWLYAVARNAIVDRSRGRSEIPADPPEEEATEPGPPEQAEAVVALLARAPGAPGPARPRANGARARVLERALAERGGDVPEHPARDGQDANAQRARAPGRRARGGAGVSREVLPTCATWSATTSRATSSSGSAASTSCSSAPARRPSFPASSPKRPSPTRRSRSCRSATGALWPLLAAALALAAFGAGWLAASAGDSDGEAFPAIDFRVPMQGTAAAPNAVASIAVGERDDAGNWPMAMTVRGLPALPEGQDYELWLTEEGQARSLVRHVPHGRRHGHVPERALPLAPVRRLGGHALGRRAPAAPNDRDLGP